jgi:hypothetical protein
MSISGTPKNELVAMELERNKLNVATLGAALDRVIGYSIKSVRRIFYVAQGITEREVGGLELVMSNGVTISLDSGIDGEAVTAKLAPWVDPFSGEMSQENRAWVQEAGKWTVFDVSAEMEYAPLVGSVVLEARLRFSESGNPSGVTFFTANRGIVANTEWDEFEVRIEALDERA